MWWGQDQNEKNSSKNIEKLQEKAIRIINFFPLNVTVEKQIYEMSILKLKLLHHASENILSICKRQDCLSEKMPHISFNGKFLHPSKLPLNHTTRLLYTYQIKVNKFKTERYGHKSIVNKNAH